SSLSYFLFFFQAEDGIRDFHVTGVQTCALPISGAAPEPGRPGPPGAGPHRTGSAAVDGARPRVSYSFTAPEVSPETSWRCITKKMMTMGSAPKSAPAAKMPPRLLYWSEMKSCIPTGRVYWSVVCRMIRARAYSE